MYDHYRVRGADYTDGVYRVVGTDEDSVTLLRVGDPDGRRVNTGELLRVRRDELDGFEAAENPDGNRPFGEMLASVPRTAYWSVWAFAEELTSHPLPAAAALALLATGSFGDGTVPLPDAAFVVLAVAGGFGLAYVGSGRLS